MLLSRPVKSSHCQNCGWNLCPAHSMLWCWELESLIKMTDSSSRLPLNTDQLNSPWSSTGSVSGRHTGPESFSLCQSSHTSSVWRTLLSKVFHHNTKWDLLLRTCGGASLPLMYPWEFKQTAVWTELWIWIHFPVISTLQKSLFFVVALLVSFVHWFLFYLLILGFAVFYVHHPQTYFKWKARNSVY